MAQHPILLGNLPGDGLGDPARTAGSKINTDIAELYSLLSEVPLALAERDDLLRSISTAGVPDQPSLVLDFVRGTYWAKGVYAGASIPAMVAAAAGNSALARSTTGTYFDRDGLLKTAAINVPRIAYDPSTRQRRGFMVEPARTNLLIYSQDFTNAAWVKTGVTVTAGASVAPDGTMTMSRLTESAVNEVHRVYQNVAVTSGSTYAFSIFAREPAGNLNKRYLVLLLPSTQFGTNIRIAVDLATGAFTSTGSPLNPEVKHVGNGIWRVSFSATATATGTSNCQLLISDTNSGSFAAFLGDGTSRLEYWGMQGEAGLGATSYIPRTSAAASRGADILTLDAASWLKQGTGTFLIEAEFDVPIGSATWFDANDGTTNNRVALRSSSVLQAQALIYDANVLQTNTVVLVAAQDTRSAIAIGYETNNVATSGNGAATVADATATIPLGIDRIGIGGRSSVEPLNGYVRRVIYYPARLSNAKLQTLSTLANWS